MTDLTKGQGEARNGGIPSQFSGCIYLAISLTSGPIQSARRPSVAYISAVKLGSDISEKSGHKFARK
jgi:hypothetical protein